MPISIHRVELQIKILDELKPDEAFHFLTIPVGAIITKPLTQVGDLLVLEYTTDDGEPTKCTVEIGVTDSNPVRDWWNNVRHSNAWSGAIVDADWDDLWEEAQAEITRIYNLALKGK